MSSALSFQWHLCDVFKVTYLISFHTIHYHLHLLTICTQHPSLLYSSPTHNAFLLLTLAPFGFCCVYMHDYCRFVLILTLFYSITAVLHVLVIFDVFPQLRLSSSLIDFYCGGDVAGGRSRSSAQLRAPCALSPTRRKCDFQRNSC